MNRSKIIKITEVEENLLKISANEVIHTLKNDPSLLHARAKAFDWWLIDDNQEVQVHVMVTRDKGDFLDDFETEEMRKG